jgi:hypothetical protein
MSAYCDAEGSLRSSSIRGANWYILSYLTILVEDMVFIPAEVANGVINIVDSCTFEVSSFSFAAPYDNDYEWYGFKGDEPTGIPISV